MFLQLLVIVFVALIAYWWANQGLFSAFMHLVCVILAGAMTFALWEPITVTFLLKPLGDHAWSVGLLGLFAVFLIIFRVAADKLVPANLNFPDWANYLVGGAFGAAAGVLTVGMLVIGMGFSQSVSSLLEFYGWTRDQSNGGQPYETEALHLPVHQWTTGFYGLLSLGSLSPIAPTAMAIYSPDLAESSLSLHRDSWGDGRGRTSVAPDDVSVQGFTYDANYALPDGGTGAYALSVSFATGAFDRGQAVTLSASQAKLVGDRAGSSRSTMAVYPVQFTEAMTDGSRGTFQFDDTANYATNPPAQQTADIDLIFPASPLSTVRFAVIKGLRLKLPQVTAGRIESLAASAGGSSKVTHLSSDGAPELSSNDIDLQNSAEPLMIGLNQAAGLDVSEEEKGNWIRSGSGDFKKSGAFNVSRGQRIKGFVCPPGASILRLNVTRDLATVDFEKLRKEYPPGTKIMLVDSEDNGYAPVGYIWDMGTDVRLNYSPETLLPTIKDFPPQSSSGNQRMKLIFIVPQGVSIRQVRAGDVVIAALDLTVTASENPY
ncbi:MAG: hypothetical protein O2800_07585 [Planctomycetota bacterium]|nr:hypothetical protein [Planctomycetota bacterium]